MAASEPGHTFTVWSPLPIIQLSGHLAERKIIALAFRNDEDDIRSLHRAANLHKHRDQRPHVLELERVYLPARHLHEANGVGQDLSSVVCALVPALGH